MRAIIVMFLLTSCSSLLAQESHPILGTWVLNTEESDARIPAPRMDVRQYTLREDGLIVGLAVWVDAGGNPGFLQFTGKTDGDHYPEYDSALLAELQANGTLSPRTFSESSVDAATTQWGNYINGEQLGSGSRFYSDNGNRMTIIINFMTPEGEQDSLSLVYDKQ